MSRKELLKWSSWPFVERPYTSLALCSFLFLLAVLLYKITVIQWGYPIFYYGGMLLVLLNLLPYFIITSYTLLETEIEIRYLFLKVSRPYSDFGCFYMDKHGLMLSTFKLPRRLDSFRGQSLRFSKTREEKEELINILEEKIGKRY